MIFDDLQVKRDSQRVHQPDAWFHQSLVGDLCIDELENCLSGKDVFDRVGGGLSI
jgi:hypothetical protein